MVFRGLVFLSQNVTLLHQNSAKLCLSNQNYLFVFKFAFTKLCKYIALTSAVPVQGGLTETPEFPLDPPQKTDTVAYNLKYTSLRVRPLKFDGNFAMPMVFAETFTTLISPSAADQGCERFHDFLQFCCCGINCSYHLE